MFYSNLKKNQLLIFQITRINLTDIMLCERSQTSKRVYAVLFHLHKVQEQAKLINDTWIYEVLVSERLEVFRISIWVVVCECIHVYILKVSSLYCMYG